MNKQIFLPSQINFNLCNPHSKKPTIVYAVVFFRGRQYKVNTGVKVIPLHWDKTKQCAIVTNSINNLHKSNNQLVNIKLNEISLHFQSFLNYICNNPEEIHDFYNIFKKKINNKMGTKRRNTKTTFERDFNNLVYDFSEKRQKRYDKLVKDIESYMKSNNIAMEWASITKEMLYDFFLEDVKTHDYMLRTFKDKIKDMYAILRHADEKEKLNDFDEKKWKKTLTYPKEPRNRQERQSAYNTLEREEVEKLVNMEFDTAIKNEIRDIFVFLCYTGIAIGDLLQLLDESKTKWIDDNNIEIRRNKTGQVATVPLHKVKGYYEQFKENGFPHTKIKGKVEGNKITITTNETNRLNKTLKQIIKESGFDREITITDSSVQTDNGKIVAKKTIQKCMMSEKITMYDSRHTFITIAYYDKMPKEQIKDIVGHVSTKMVDEIYLKLDEEREAIAKAERNNKFFGTHAPQSTTPQPTDNGENVAYPPMWTNILELDPDYAEAMAEIRKGNYE